ncbi:MAG: class I SAM-dependent methyltransferase [Caldilineaceae bacterium]
MIGRLLGKPGGWRARLVEGLGGDVLEIGVGTGANLPYYRNAASVTAIEPDPDRAQEAQAAALQAATQLGISVRIDVAPAESLPYPDASFDVVVSSLVFCSVADQSLALEEIHRVLRKDGLLWMVEHVRPRTPILARLATFVTPGWRRIAHNCHLDRPTLTLLQDAGWQVEVLRRRGVFVKLRAHRGME